MEIKKVVGSVVLTIALCLTSLQASAVETWTPPMPTPGSQGVTLGEVADFPSVSYISANKLQPGSATQYALCQKLGEAECSKDSGWNINASISLGVCEGAEVNCIESVQIYQKGTTPKKAKFLSNAQAPTFAADLDAGLPRGSSTGIWQAEDLPHSGGNSNYAVWVSMSATVRDGKASFTSFSAGVAGVVEDSNGGMQSPLPQLGADPFSGAQHIRVINSSRECVYNFNMLCGHRHDFSPNTRVGLTLRISNSLTGWLLGRLKDPVINVSKLSSTMNRISIEADPSEVAKTAFNFTPSTFPDSLKNNSAFKFLAERINSQTPVLSSPFVSDSSAMDTVEGLRQVTNDTASGLASVWAVRSLQKYSQVAGSRCLADTSKLLGLVTTNAMAFEGGPPVFKKGFLEYKVAGMHFEPDGTTPVYGTYDLIMRSEVARCLYSFSKAPLSATVSVVNDKGTKTTATTVVSEKNGWLKMAAYGFTFSKKTIKVKITKKKK